MIDHKTNHQLTIDTFYKKLFVSSIIQETPDVKTYTLRTEEDIPYTPGQFLTLVFVRSGIEERRSYSISSSPALKEQLAIMIKRIPNGEYSRKLTETLKVGDELITIGAAGFFCLPEEMSNTHQLVFLAAGSGITPIYPLIKTVLYTYPDKKILLIYSNRSKEETIFYHQLQQLQADFKGRFVIEYFFSDSKNISHARISNIWLETMLRNRHIGSDSNTLFYMCGPFDYMLMVNITLRSYGVPAANIKKEHFSTFKAPPRELPPDSDLHEVELITGENTHRFSTQYPISILQKAKQLNIDLPYSCEAGRCGTCVARCVEGKVWMSNNEVLLDEEIANGLILTCVAYAVGGDVKIEI